MLTWRPWLTALLVSLLVVAGCPGDPDDDDDGGDDDAADDDAGDDDGADDDAGDDDAGDDDAGDDDTAPHVAILAPADGAEPENPVLFSIEASHVDTVQILADDWPLSDPWDPTTTTTLQYTFQGVGTPREIELRGFVSGEPDAVAEHGITITVVDPGVLVGAMWNTYYYLAEEADYPGADDTTLYDSSCSPIAEVPADYSDDVCIEGSGKLEDGRVINYATTCGCGRTCPTGGIVCYSVLDDSLFPWGMGSQSNPLVPLVSWAVDSSFLSFGTTLYVPEWDGVVMPSDSGLGGFAHDGCFRADDVGGWIQGNHYDFFAGTHDLWLDLEAIRPTGSKVTVYRDASRCAYLQ